MAARTGATFVASTDVMISPFTVLRPTRIASIPISLFVVLSFSLAASAADLDAARKDFLSGKYAACIRETEEAIRGGEYGEDWPLLLTQAQMTTGQYPAAYQTLTNALSRYVQSVRLRLLARDVFRFSSRTNEADEAIDEINQLATSRAWSYRDPANLVALGRCALLIGADPKQVLDKLYDQAKRADPNHRDAYLAAGELALEKDDYQLAARNFQDGLKKFPDDPDFHYGLARAFESGDRKQLLESLTAALAKNPNHIPSLLLKVDHLVDAEEYAEAAKELEKILSINAWEPEAWAYRAVLAHLRADRDGERASREKGLKFWKTNPQVDHLIGQKLSQKYRFAEGAVYQQRALDFDPKFLPAQTQLAQDKLRLGDEEDGWRLAEAAHAHDAYNVGLYNLVTLKDAFAKFQAVTNENFVVRMSAHEAPIYGRRALHLLERAQTNLCQKYGVELQKPTLVEIFPEQKDFGVRTFGMPDNPGFLGVCFGRVITANSPASQGGHPANWEAVLWHEFCHVVTLQLTKNKMPRWLSEGISVYEEKQANPTWGQAMNPKYREMILEKDELTPVSELSAAFLSPKSPLHLQFAYYESSLVVEFLVSRFGADALKKILIDLRDDIEINAAIEKNTEAMDKIEDEFETFAIKRAQDLAPGLDWKKPRLATAAALERNTARRGGPAPSRNPARRPLNSDTNNPAAGTNSAPKIAGPTLTNTPPAPRVAVVGTDNPIAAATTNASPKPPEAAVTNNFYALNQQARKAMEAKKWQDAKEPLKKLIELYPEQTGDDSAYVALAEIHHELGETNEEKNVLTKLASIDSDALDAYLRLMEIGEKDKDWPAVSENAERFLAVNPLVPQPHRFLAHASEATGKSAVAIDGYQTLLLLDPPDPADVHFHLAKLLHAQGDAAARQHILKCLEEAPRFRDGHKLLLEILGAKRTAQAAAPGEGK